jgi:hypothetical protein
VPIKLAPCGTGFLVLREKAGSLAPTRESRYLQTLQKPIAADGVGVVGPWHVTFGDMTVEMPTLIDWTKSDNTRIKYFSGTAKYHTTFECHDMNGADILSLGDCNGQVARIVLNGRDVGTVWCEPYEVLLPLGAVKAGTNELEIEFTNVWANRLIGDEQEPPDCKFVKAVYPGGWYLESFPDWFKDGIAARPSKGRKCFTDWNYFTKDSKLTPSGLLGPVTLTSSPSDSGSPNACLR